MVEEWRDIQDYEGLYQISNLGRVRSLDRTVVAKNGISRVLKGEIKSVTKRSDFYSHVILFKSGKRKTKGIHRLIAESFIDNPNGLGFVNHINGIPSDNRIENLEWCTHSQNIQHAVDTGLKPPVLGEKHGRSKLKEYQVLEIRAMLSSGIPQTEIMKSYGIGRKTVYEIKIRKTWKHI